MKAVWLFWLWIKEVVIGLLRNGRSNFNVLILSSICLALFSFFFIFGENVQFLAQGLGSKVEIQVDVRETVDASEHQKVEDRIKGMAYVKEVHYVSKEEAMKNARKLMEGVEEALESLEENPFPASYVITLHDSNDVKQAAEELRTWSEFENVKYGKYVDNLLQVSNLFKKIGFFVSVAVALYAVIIIGSTIKRNIAQRSNEIEIKRQIGANMLTIRVPFVLEMVCVTMLASVFVYISISFGYPMMVSYLQERVPFLGFVPSTIMLGKLDEWIFLMGLVVGVLGSVTSVRKYVQRF